MKNQASRLRVLLVDDKSQVRQDLSVLLELTGLIEIVGEAADGQQAVALADSLRPEVVVMDLQMPGMDGCMATCQLKELGLAQRVVILTVHGDTDSLQRARDAGADELVLKGAPLDTLLHAIIA